MKTTTLIADPSILGGVTITVPGVVLNTPTIEVVPCTACSCSGVYMDYGGPGIGGVAVACSVCGGRGWLPPGVVKK